MKLLFLCSQNRWRSLTAEKVLHGVDGYEVRSSGTENNARIKVTSGHIGWVDVIFVMEKKHLRRIQEKYGEMLNDKKVIVLGITDDYRFMDEDLIEMLKCRVAKYFE